MAATSPAPRSSDGRLERYARLVISAGCNVQKGQKVYLTADVGDAALVRALVEASYERKASDVVVYWTDEACTRLDYLGRDLSSFRRYPDWHAALLDEMVRERAALVFVSHVEPSTLAGVDQRKVVADHQARAAACPGWDDAMQHARTTWCMVCGARPSWARRVYPGLSEDKALARLWDELFAACRVDERDPQGAWNRHLDELDRRKRQLDRLHLRTLRYRTGRGTDLTVGLIPGALWQGGAWKTGEGVRFSPNIPTEEVYISPDLETASGTVVISRPLDFGGTLVSDVALVFDQGRVTDVDAGAHTATFRQVLAADEGACRLGEVSLVPAESPIGRSGHVFYETLLDENAASHVALGMGFADCLPPDQCEQRPDGDDETERARLRKHGVNTSMLHVDLMVGTPDLSVEGTCADGHVVPLFEDGTWSPELDRLADGRS